MPLAITGLPLTCSASVATGPVIFWYHCVVVNRVPAESATGTLPPMLYSLFSGPVPSMSTKQPSAPLWASWDLQLRAT